MILHMVQLSLLSFLIQDSKVFPLFCVFLLDAGKSLSTLSFGMLGFLTFFLKPGPRHAAACPPGLNSMHGFSRLSSLPQAAAEVHSLPALEIFFKTLIKSFHLSLLLHSFTNETKNPKRGP